MYPALTARPPWGHAIVYLGMDVLSRDWTTTYRGWTWVHQGKTRDRNAPDFLVPDYALTLSAVIGAVRIEEVTGHSASQWADLSRPHHLELADARYLPEPLPVAVGRQNLWYSPLLAQLPEPDTLPVAPLPDPRVPLQRGPSSEPPRGRGAAVFSPDTPRK
jgi:hypothetical protein